MAGTLPALAAHMKKKIHRAAHGFGKKSLGGAYDFFRAHSAQCEITFFLFAPFFLEICSLFGFSVLSLLSLLSPPHVLDLRIVRAWCAHSLRMQRGWFAYFCSVSPLSCFFSLSLCLSLYLSLPLSLSLSLSVSLSFSLLPLSHTVCLISVSLSLSLPISFSFLSQSLLSLSQSSLSSYPFFPIYFTLLICA